MSRAITTGYYGSTDGSDGAYTTQDIYGSASGADQSRWIPEIFSKKVLVQFYNESTSVQLCNTDYQGDISSAGDSVVIRKDPTVTTSDYTIGGTIDYEVPKEDAITMLIDQFKSNSFRIDTIDQLQSDIGLPNRFLDACKESMKQTIDQEMFNYMVAGVANGGAIDTPIVDTSGTLVAAGNRGVTAGVNSGAYDLGAEGTNGGSAVAITKDNIHQLMVEMNAALEEAKQVGDWFVMTPAMASKIKLSDLNQSDISGDATAMKRTGLIGTVDGSKVYVTNNAPTYSEGTATLHAILAGNSNFCSFASQITESETLPIPDSFGKYYRQLNCYGRRVVQSTSAALAICTI